MLDKKLLQTSVKVSTEHAPLIGTLNRDEVAMSTLTLPVGTSL